MISGPEHSGAGIARCTYRLRAVGCALTNMTFGERNRYPKYVTCAPVPSYPTHIERQNPMKDPRYAELARLLVEHSIELVAGDKVLIECFDIPTDFTSEL